MWNATAFVVKYLWRFFSGAHMNGKTHNDATFWRDASPRYRVRRLAYTWWRRKARYKRVLWRNGIFWPVVILVALLIAYPSYTILALLAFSPFIAYVVFRRVRLLTHNPVTQTLADGEIVQHWIRKPWLTHAIARVKHEERKRPGLARRTELMPKTRLVPVPSEYRQAVVAELSEELEGQPPTEMKLLMSPGDE
jgi:hypothetical protein